MTLYMYMYELYLPNYSIQKEVWLRCGQHKDTHTVDTIPYGT